MEVLNMNSEKGKRINVQSKVQPKKILVRNTVVPLNVGARPKRQEMSTKYTKNTVVNECNKEPEKYTLSDLNLPERNTMLHIADEISETENKFNIPDATEFIPFNNLRLNFTPEDVLYHGLIDVNLPENTYSFKDYRSTIPKPRLEKDPEPDTKKHLSHADPVEYTFKFKVTPEMAQKKSYFSGLSLYEITQKWKT